MKPSRQLRRKAEARKLDTASDDARKKTSRIRPRPTSAKFLTVKELAERWGISERQVRRIIESGELKIHRIGRSVRIAIEDIELFEHRCRGVAI